MIEIEDCELVPEKYAVKYRSKKKKLSILLNVLQLNSIASDDLGNGQCSDTLTKSLEAVSSPTTRIANYVRLWSCHSSFIHQEQVEYFTILHYIASALCSALLLSTSLGLYPSFVACLPSAEQDPT
jgi:hypothetical protein